MLMQALMKAGVTRGKRLVVLVGQRKAVAIAVRNVSGRRRWSKLGERLRPSPVLVLLSQKAAGHIDRESSTWRDSRLARGELTWIPGAVRRSKPVLLGI